MSIYNILFKKNKGQGFAGHIKADGTPNIEMTLRYVKPG
jgi:hypothetical protein